MPRQKRGKRKRLLMKKTKIKPPPNWEDTPQSFERFERLAKQLMTVPKEKVTKKSDSNNSKNGRSKALKTP
jgi:hypothetical protein